MSVTSRLELSVKVVREDDAVSAAVRGDRLRNGEVVYDSTISIPVKSLDRKAVEPVVDQWMAMMDAAMKLIATREP